MKTNCSSLLVLTTVLTFLSLTFIATKSRAQKNYFYGSVSIPVIDYVDNLILEQDRNSEVDGIILDFGYGININKRLLIEAGLEAFAFNPSKTKYQQQNVKDFISLRELDISNKAFALQIRPVWSLDMGESSSFRIACAINFQKIYSTGNYYKYESNPSALSIEQKSTSNTTSPFHMVLQPLIGADFKMENNWGFGFDFRYVGLKWNKSLQSMNFGADQFHSIPEYKTSNLFLTTRIFF